MDFCRKIHAESARPPFCRTGTGKAPNDSLWYGKLEFLFSFVLIPISSKVSKTMEY